jgi:hypothetical protein
MTFESLTALSCGAIALWATWCALSGKVCDGVLGKFIYAAIAISGYAIFARKENFFFGPTVAGVTLHMALATAGARHWFIATYWPQFKTRVHRVIALLRKSR